jgi:hypothetical protein
MKKLLSLATLSTLAFISYHFDVLAEATPETVDAVVETTVHTVIHNGKVIGHEIGGTKTLLDHKHKDHQDEALKKVAEAMAKHPKTATLAGDFTTTKKGTKGQTTNQKVNTTQKNTPVQKGSTGGGTNWGSVLTAGVQGLSSITQHVVGPIVTGGMNMGNMALQNHFTTTQANTQFNQQQQLQNTQFNQNMQMMKMQQDAKTQQHTQELAQQKMQQEAAEKQKMGQKQTQQNSQQVKKTVQETNTQQQGTEQTLSKNQLKKLRKAEQESKLKAEQEAKLKAEREAKLKAEREAGLSKNQLKKLKS